VFGKQRQADRGGELGQAPALVLHFHVGEQRHQFAGTAQRHRAIHFRKDDQEFLAALAAGDVLAARLRLQHAREGGEDRVPGGMAVVVVEGLEVVEVEGEHRQRQVAARAARDFTAERLGQVAAVEQPGERVAHRQVAQVLAQLEVGEREGELVGRGHRHLQLRHRAQALGTQVQPAERIALRGERDAGGGELAAVRGHVRAHRLGEVAAAQVHAPVVHALAFLGAGLRAGVGSVLSPQVRGLGEAFALHERIDAAGDVRQQLREHLLAGLQRLGQVGAADQQVAEAAEQFQVAIEAFLRAARFHRIGLRREALGLRRLPRRARGNRASPHRDRYRHGDRERRPQGHPCAVHARHLRARGGIRQCTTSRIA
jgi:hypothetical protein